MNLGASSEAHGFSALAIHRAIRRGRRTRRALFAPPPSAVPPRASQAAVSIADLTICGGELAAKLMMSPEVVAEYRLTWRFREGASRAPQDSVTFYVCHLFLN